MSWEDIAQEVADGWNMSYQEAFTLVQFIARKLRSGNADIRTRPDQRWRRDRY